MMQELNVKDAIGMICHVADVIIDNKPYLTEVDSQIGDGDYGIGMALGFHKAKEAVSAMYNETNVYSIFAAAGRAMLMSMGGASGVIFSSMFSAGAKGMPQQECITAFEFYEMMSRSLTAICQRGGAQVGDKTMVDAFAPAVAAMKEAYDAGFEEMLKSAEISAKKGMEDSKKYIAKYGRAKSLMERAVGYQDAGATSVWLIFKAMSEYVCHPDVA